MRWKQGKRSSNIEDRRGRGGGVRTGAKVGGGAIIIALLGVLLFGQDPGELINVIAGGGGQQQAPSQQAPPGPRPDDEAADFVSVVLGDTEQTWNQIFANAGQRYPEPTLVLFDDVVQSACGVNSAATGPFYCPGDSKLYLDLSFLRELQKLGASGDFAVAYVIAHEVGHHIQNVTGLEKQVRQRQRQASSKAQANDLSVRMELQADCYAGVWGYYAKNDRNLLESGDVEEGLRAAAAIGDDRLQKMAGRRVQRESFTHGSSEQRVRWFRTGLQSGDVNQCDTFN